MTREQASPSIILVKLMQCILPIPVQEMKQYGSILVQSGFINMHVEPGLLLEILLQNPTLASKPGV